jgi:hypothetical protein
LHERRRFDTLKSKGNEASQELAGIGSKRLLFLYYFLYVLMISLNPKYLPPSMGVKNWKALAGSESLLGELWFFRVSNFGVNYYARNRPQENSR